MSYRRRQARLNEPTRGEPPATTEDDALYERVRIARGDDTFAAVMLRLFHEEDARIERKARRAAYEREEVARGFRPATLDAIRALGIDPLAPDTSYTAYESLKPDPLHSDLLRKRDPMWDGPYAKYRKDRAILVVSSGGRTLIATHAIGIGDDGNLLTSHAGDFIEIHEGDARGRRRAKKGDTG